MYAFKDVALVTPGGVIENGVLVTEEDRIRALGPEADVPVPSQAQVIDGQGMYLAPGFIELQLNGGFGEDFTDNPDSIWRVAAQLPRYGVTSFLPTIITCGEDTLNHALRALRRGRPADFRGAVPLGLHVEGPFLNPAKKGAHNPAYITAPDARRAADWSPETGVRLVTLAPELPGAHEVIGVLRNNGVVVSAGHSMATYEEAMEAFSDGITYGTHLFNAQPPLDHRQPGLSAALLRARSVAVGIIPDGIHVHPAMVDLAWRAKGPRGLTLVTDAMAAMGMTPGEYRLGDFTVTVDETSARLADGTLAGSILTLDAALRNLMDYTGASLVEALPCVTSTPASVLGLANVGVIRAGAKADLVLLDQDGYVVLTMTGGDLFYQRGKLNEPAE